MLTWLSSLRSAAGAVTLLAALAATSPQADAAARPTVPVSKKADAATRAFVKADPAPAGAAATVCGAGYALEKMVPLPEGTNPNQRLGALFAYSNNGQGCVILDNNTGPSQYMYIRICDVLGKNCQTDSGTYTDYAGPVRVSSFACAQVTAKMGQTASSLYIDYKSDYVFPCD